MSTSLIHKLRKAAGWLRGDQKPDRLAQWEARVKIQIHDWQLPRGKTSVRPSASSEAKIHLVYFSYSKDFELLRHSLISLSEVAGQEVDSIYIYEDPGAPFSDSQGETLRILMTEQRLKIHMRRAKSRILPGYRMTLAMSRAYQELASEIPDGDWLGKVDCDVLWTSDLIFNELRVSETEMVGHPCRSYQHLTGFVFTQGGAYFLRGSALRKICAQPIAPVAFSVLPGLIPHYDVRRLSEDNCTFMRAQNAGLSISFHEFFAPMHSLNSQQTPDPAFSALHFEGEGMKERMLVVATKQT